MINSPVADIIHKSKLAKLYRLGALVAVISMPGTLSSESVKLHEQLQRAVDLAQAKRVACTARLQHCIVGAVTIKCFQFSVTARGEIVEQKI